MADPKKEDVKLSDFTKRVLKLTEEKKANATSNPDKPSVWQKPDRPQTEDVAARQAWEARTKGADRSVQDTLNRPFKVTQGYVYPPDSPSWADQATQGIAQTLNLHPKGPPVMDGGELDSRVNQAIRNASVKKAPAAPAPMQKPVTMDPPAHGHYTEYIPVGGEYPKNAVKPKAPRVPVASDIKGLAGTPAVASKPTEGTLERANNALWDGANRYQASKKKGAEALIEANYNMWDKGIIPAGRAVEAAPGKAWDFVTGATEAIGEDLEPALPRSVVNANDKMWDFILRKNTKK